MQKDTFSNSIYRNIPNAVTITGLIFGCLAIEAAMRGSTKSINHACVYIGFAVLADFFDGFLARLLKQTSEYGKILDTLVDIISFGVAPAIIMYKLFPYAYYMDPEWIPSFISKSIAFRASCLLIIFCIIIFSALRLTKYTVKANNLRFFKGLPTPSNAIFISSLAIIGINDQFYDTFMCQIVHNTYILLLLLILQSILMILPIKMFSLKITSLSLKDNFVIYGFLLIAAVLLLIFKLMAIPIIIYVYIFISVLINIFYKKYFQEENSGKEKQNS